MSEYKIVCPNCQGDDIDIVEEMSEIDYKTFRGSIIQLGYCQDCCRYFTVYLKCRIYDIEYKQ